MGKARYGAMPHKQGGGNKGVAPKTAEENFDHSSDGGGHSEVSKAAEALYNKAHTGSGGGDSAIKTR